MKIKDLKQFINFLGEALGKNCEIALQDCSKGCIEAIINGHISGRKVGSPLTDLAKEIIASRDWEKCDYITGYEGHTLDGKLLRSSTFFIKEDGNLAGMLCINVDTSCYSQMSDLILTLGGLTATGKTVLTGNEANYRQETFIDSIEDVVNSVFREIYENEIPDKFTQEDRLNIIRHLEGKKTFNIKGTISYMAERLHCSEASIYRYLSHIRKEDRNAKRNE